MQRLRRHPPAQDPGKISAEDKQAQASKAQGPVDRATIERAAAVIGGLKHGKAPRKFFAALICAGPALSFHGEFARCHKECVKFVAGLPARSYLRRMTENDGQHAHGESLPALAIGAIGVVFGDIGTSPLYAIQATMSGEHPLAIDLTNTYGVVSMIFWTMIVLVTIKYVFIVMRCDNQGEGGSLALLALINRKLPDTNGRLWLTACGLLATSLFYADSMLTPAISVISAVEGLNVVSSKFQPFIVPIALAILLGLFVLQARGTDRVGKMFGPVMLVYFVVIAAMGIGNIRLHPQVLWEPLNPVWIIRFFAAHPLLSFLSMGAIVYAITGVEALYADMGHFGRKPIQMSWLYLVMPCLVLNYMGQAALLIAHPDAVSNPFFNMVPKQLLIPLLLLATMATVIASQAVITGAFSVTQQAIQLGYMPRVQITHTSSSMAGQIYIPVINWFLALMVALLVATFRSSAAMLPAYGLAVVGTMLITTAMQYVVIFRVWKSRWWQAGFGLVVFTVIDATYLAAGSAKFFEGAWFPIAVGAVIFLFLTTWSRGRKLMRQNMATGAIPIEIFIKSAHGSVKRVAGSSVFLSSTIEGIPPALLHNLKHNHILHERVAILTVATQGVPHVPPEQRRTVEPLGHGFYRIVLRYGFMDQVDIPAELAAEDRAGGPFRPMETSYFLSRQTLLPATRPGMAVWREKLFAWMVRNAESAMEFFKLPTNRVIELGSQVEI